MCEYCYARRIYNRFNPHIPFDAISYHSGRLVEKFPSKPATIFVGSMSDNAYWDRSWMNRILLRCASAPHHTFMFLSKSFEGYQDWDWPENTMQGLTMTMQESYGFQSLKLTRLSKLPRPFLSVEPLLGNLRVLIPPNIKPVIVGAMTGPGAYPAAEQWVKSIRKFVPEDRIIWKNSIKDLADREKSNEESGYFPSL